MKTWREIEAINSRGMGVSRPCNHPNKLIGLHEIGCLHCRVWWYDARQREVLKRTAIAIQNAA
jgi:hypothetical protein